MTPDKLDEAKGAHWEDRVLCPDESCVGTIGSDGNCRICGRAQNGDLRGAYHEGEDDFNADTDSYTVEGEFSYGVEEGQEDAETGFEWEERQLCGDESCIGAIGPDGVCRVCGKSRDETLMPETEDSPGESEAPVASASDDVANDAQNEIEFRICSDDNCIGVVGADGLCKMCGKPYESD